MITITHTYLNGVFVVTGSDATDRRGCFVKQFHAPLFTRAGWSGTWAEAYWSRSRKHVIRGMHFQAPPSDHAKLVSCVHGAIFDVALDLRCSSPTYLRSLTQELSDTNGHSLFIPRGFAHGFMALTDGAVVQYLVETVHDPARDNGVRWDSCDVNWPLTAPAIVSDRDGSLPTLSDFKSPFA